MRGPRRSDRWTKPKIDLTNQETGEVLGAIEGTVRRRGYHPYEFAWHVVSGEAYEVALKYLTTAPEMRLFVRLPLWMKDGNWLTMSQTVMAGRAEMQPASLSRAMQRLKAGKIVMEVDGGWQFDPHIAWRGTNGGLRRAMSRWDEVKGVSDG